MNKVKITNISSKLSKLKKYTLLRANSFILASVLALTPINYNSISSLAATNKTQIGCDMSDSQLQDKCNWQELNKNFDFIILKATEGRLKQNIDQNFAYFSNMCEKYSIPYGAYCYGIYPSKLNSNKLKQHQQDQVDLFLKTIEDKNITLPCYLDIEEENIKFTENKEKFTIVLDTWKNNISQKGLLPGIYTNKSGYEKILTAANQYNYDLSQFEFWISGSFANNYKQSKNLSQLTIPTTNTYSYKGEKYTASILQVSDSITDGGASDNQGKLDINVAFKDYQHPNQTPFKSKNVISILLASGAILAIRQAVKKKQKLKF